MAVAQRNSAAALQWAEDRQQKLARAQEVREQRKQEAHARRLAALGLADAGADYDDPAPAPVHQRTDDAPTAYHSQYLTQQLPPEDPRVKAAEAAARRRALLQDNIPGGYGAPAASLSPRLVPAAQQHHQYDYQGEHSDQVEHSRADGRAASQEWLRGRTNEVAHSSPRNAADSFAFQEPARKGNSIAAINARRTAQFGRRSGQPVEQGWQPERRVAADALPQPRWDDDYSSPEYAAGRPPLHANAAAHSAMQPSYRFQSAAQPAATDSPSRQYNDGFVSQIPRPQALSTAAAPDGYPRTMARQARASAPHHQGISYGYPASQQPNYGSTEPPRHPEAHARAAQRQDSEASYWDSKQAPSPLHWHHAEAPPVQDFTQRLPRTAKHAQHAQQRQRDVLRLDAQAGAPTHQPASAHAHPRHPSAPQPYTSVHQPHSASAQEAYPTEDASYEPSGQAGGARPIWLDRRDEPPPEGALHWHLQEQPKPPRRKPQGQTQSVRPPAALPASAARVPAMSTAGTLEHGTGSRQARTAPDSGTSQPGSARSINRAGLSQLKAAMIGRRRSSSADSASAPSPVSFSSPSSAAAASHGSSTAGPAGRARPAGTSYSSAAYDEPIPPVSQRPARSHAHAVQPPASSYDAPDTDGSAVEPEVQSNLVQCSGCGRSFNEKAYAVHSRICAKVFQTKRKAFNTAEARMADPDAAKFFDAKTGQPKAEAPVLGRPNRPSRRAAPIARQPSYDDEAVGGRGPGTQPKWKQRSEQLRAAMRTTKGAAAGFGNIGSLPALVDDALIPCPHCGRRFNETAAERHIPKCQDIINKPSRLNAHGGKAAYMRGPARQAASPSWGPTRRAR